MAMTLAQRRKKDRERKAADRAAAKAAGVPSVETVYIAIVEATAYALAHANIDAGRSGPATQMIDAGLMMKVATAILAKRGGFDEQHSKRLIKRLLSPRPEHRWPTYIPSLLPLPDWQAA